MEPDHNILFVDDDSRLLRGLQRALGSQVGFGLYFAQKGEKAFDIIRKNKIDFVVSGVKLGDMTGSNLLEKVRRINPASVRVMFASNEEKEEHKGNSPVHMYIDRPCDCTGLMQKLQKVSSRWSKATANYRQMVANAQLPPLLNATIDYVEKCNVLDTENTELINILAKDPGFLSLAIYRQRRNMAGFVFNDLPDMVVKLLNRDKALHNGLLACGSIRRIGDTGLVSLQSEIYEHCVSTAKLACKIASERFGEGTVITSRAMLAGLLHDIGKLIIAEQFPQQSRLTVPDCQAAHEVLSANELIADHRLLASLLFSLWGMPEDVVDAIAHNNSYNPIGNNNYVYDILIEADYMATAMLVGSESGSDFGV
ncbi:MAG: HDOD domain-containing protein [Sedimentisphaerales bacterium]|nr:HDOD domain-containing protein [Sedimentisphaerales bacterium]MBN2844034.1 HDOD domain-containing protein [Sedimentisphaerales bacterium]